MRRIACWLGAVCGLVSFLPTVDVLAADQSPVSRVPPIRDGLLVSEKLPGQGTWIDPAFMVRFRQVSRVRATVWFEDQLLGDGKAYLRRSKEFSGRQRGELGQAAMKTLQAIHARSWKEAKPRLDQLLDEGKISQVQPHWIVNGFSCVVVQETLESLQTVPGVRKIFASPRRLANRLRPRGDVPGFLPQPRPPFDPTRYKHPWYIHALQANRVWNKFEITGAGTLNVIHDFNFVFSDNLAVNLYRNPGEVPANGKDDDGNGLVDDYHGYDFDRGTAALTNQPVPLKTASPSGMHGFMCAAVVCGRGLPGKEYEFGIAPEARWAGVIGGGHLEKTVQWAIEQGADTYSMSFSIPGLKEFRSHWRKLMEHGSLCGVFFVSGAGNFAQTAKVPVQMRIPEDIPEVVFAAAGVQRDFRRTPFSSQGPVKWHTEHYQDGLVQKPEVCAFNLGLPLLQRDGAVKPVALNGNSFAGPMFCGTIALMLSADPDLLPWDLKAIITSTATDVAAPGIDYQTGHGLINSYRAVKEVLRRKAVRTGQDPAPYTGREPGDALDIAAETAALIRFEIKIVRVVAGGQAAQVGLRAGDVLLRYDDVPITTPTGLRAVVAAVVQKRKEQVVFVVERRGKEMQFTVKPGKLGISLGAEYLAPVFK
ncbi:MAG: S8 family serine peptidase [Pirellulaceae bacterium]